MRAREFVAFAGLAFLAGGCTAFIAAQLSNDQGDGGNPPPPPVGGCFQLPQNQCGSCIAQNCEKPSASPPVSLAAVCSFDPYSTVALDVSGCANDPTATASSDHCAQFFQDGGTYASDISTQSAAENNVELCVRDNCMTSCRTCSSDVTVCKTNTTPLPDAGACGACLYNAMSLPGAVCQDQLLAETSGCGDVTTDLSACATPKGGTACATADCSAFEQADAGLRGCLWAACASSCPNQ